MRKFITVFFALFVGFNIASAQNNGEDTLHSITVDGVQRDWRIYVPTTYSKETLIPMVLNFHGTSGRLS